MKKVLLGLVIVSVVLVITNMMINKEYSKIDKVDEYCEVIEKKISKRIDHYFSSLDKLELLEEYDPKVIEPITRRFGVELNDLAGSDKAWNEYMRQKNDIIKYTSNHFDNFGNIINIYSILCK